MDLKEAYQQLQVSDKSKKLLTLNTHIGLFSFNRLTFGISAAPGIFQNVMDTIPAGLPDCNDILVFGKNVGSCYHQFDKSTKSSSRLHCKR